MENNTRLEKMRERKKLEFLERITQEQEKMRQIQLERERVAMEKKRLKEELDREKKAVLEEFEKKKRKLASNKESLANMSWEVRSESVSPPHKISSPKMKSGRSAAGLYVNKSQTLPKINRIQTQMLFSKPEESNGAEKKEETVENNTGENEVIKEEKITEANTKRKNIKITSRKSGQNLFVSPYSQKLSEKSNRLSKIFEYYRNANLCQRKSDVFEEQKRS